MAKAIMADSISYLPEFQAWDTYIKNAFADIDLSKLLVYMIDTVDASAIPALAEQFDVLGYKGLKLADNEAEQRDIIKRAIELHRYKGTEWAIKEALLSIGFADIELIKTGYDHWAKFGLKITNEDVVLTDESFNDIIQMVTEYKRAVCVLMEVLMTKLVNDTITITDIEASVRPAIQAIDVIKLSQPLQYDGTAIHDGSYIYSGDTDVAEITEL